MRVESKDDNDKRRITRRRCRIETIEGGNELLVIDKCSYNTRRMVDVNGE
jgi:hypothetical protein